MRISAAGVCHSDYHFMNGDLPIGLPCVLGHEGAGVVEEVGEGVTTVAPGDHVVLLFRPNCGHCEFCSQGRPALCWMAAQFRNTGSSELRFLCVTTPPWPGEKEAIVEPNLGAWPIQGG